MEYLRRLRIFWFPDWMNLVWLLLAIPALYFFQTTLHEGSHAVAALFATGNFPKVAPFPHTTSDGSFLNGVTLGDPSTIVTVTKRTSCTSPVKSSVSKLAGFPAVPQFLDLLLIILFSLIFAFTTVSNPFVRFALRTWYLGACLDFMYNTARALVGGCKESTDWSKFMLEADISSGLFALLTWIFWLGVLSFFVWVYWSTWVRQAPARTDFWDYRWIAMILGILSFFAVLLSIFVSDDSIHKDSAAFIVPFIVQILALVWYWIYFGLTYRRQGTQEQIGRG